LNCFHNSDRHAAVFKSLETGMNKDESTMPYQYLERRQP
jgi:hypothetical protein